jgi:hypothetical protein
LAAEVLEAEAVGVVREVREVSAAEVSEEQELL